VGDFLKNIIRFAAFIFIQVYLLDKTHLHRFIIPYIYYLFILWLPFSVSRMGLMFIGFLLGITLDMFKTTPGLHAAACVLIAYLRPFVINVLILPMYWYLRYATTVT
jgi:rod shape-determining protein MreD